MFWTAPSLFLLNTTLHSPPTFGASIVISKVILIQLSGHCMCISLALGYGCSVHWMARKSFLLMWNWLYICVCVCIDCNRLMGLEKIPRNPLTGKLPRAYWNFHGGELSLRRKFDFTSIVTSTEYCISSACKLKREKMTFNNIYFKAWLGKVTWVGAVVFVMGI